MRLSRVTAGHRAQAVGECFGMVAILVHRRAMGEDVPMKPMLATVARRAGTLLPAPRLGNLRARHAAVTPEV